MKDLKLLKQDIKAAPKKARAVQTSPRRQERQQQPIRQIDYTFDFDNPSADGFPRAIVPSEAHMRFSGEFVMTFWAIKNGEKRELCNIHMSTKNTSPFH